MIFLRTLLIAGIFLGTFLITSFAHNNKPVASKIPFAQFPMEIGEWKGKSEQIDQRQYAVLGVEDYVFTNFYQPEMPLINFYLGYYESQKQGDTIHSPKNCLPGSGWNILDSQTVSIKIPGKKSPVTLAKLILGKGNYRQVVLYWFHSRGRIISNEYMQKIWLVVDSILRHRTDGSFVRLISPVVKDEAVTTEILLNFAQKIFPVLDQYIPS